jgi:hypothetical protein
VAYPGDIDEGAFDWSTRRKPAPRLRVIARQETAGISAPVSAIALVFAALVAGSFLTFVLFAPMAAHTARTLPAVIDIAGVGR